MSTLLDRTLDRDAELIAMRRLLDYGQGSFSSAVAVCNSPVERDRIITDVRGKGLMLGVEFDTPDHAEEVQWAAFERGLLVLECGKSSVRMSPALTVSEAEMDTALRIFGEAVGDVAHEHGEILEAAMNAGAITGVESAV